MLPGSSAGRRRTPRGGRTQSDQRWPTGSGRRSSRRAIGGAVVHRRSPRTRLGVQIEDVALLRGDETEVPVASSGKLAPTATGESRTAVSGPRELGARSTAASRARWAPDVTVTSPSGRGRSRRVSPPGSPPFRVCARPPKRRGGVVWVSGECYDGPHGFPTGISQAGYRYRADFASSRIRRRYESPPDPREPSHRRQPANEEHPSSPLDASPATSSKGSLS